MNEETELEHFIRITTPVEAGERDLEVLRQYADWRNDADLGDPEYSDHDLAVPRRLADWELDVAREELDRGER